MPPLSPALLGRVVKEAGCARISSSFKRAFTREVLPHPDGAETTKICPLLSGMALFYVLDLLSYLFDLAFYGNGRLSDLIIVRLLADGIYLAVQFLSDEIQLSAHLIPLVQGLSEALEMGLDPCYFFGDVGIFGEQSHFELYPPLIEVYLS